MKKLKKTSLLPLLLAVLLILLNRVIFPPDADEQDSDFDYYAQTEDGRPLEEGLSEDEYYYSAEEVAAYIHQFKHLPDNFIKKADAEKLGWNGGSLDKIQKGMVIGGDYFGNYEGLLPEGKTYTECDVNCPKNSRGGERIIFSDDGWIYYTPDHYETFETIYVGA